MVIHHIPGGHKKFSECVKIIEKFSNSENISDIPRPLYDVFVPHVNTNRLVLTSKLSV